MRRLASISQQPAPASVGVDIYVYVLALSDAAVARQPDQPKPDRLSSRINDRRFWDKQIEIAWRSRRRSMDKYMEIAWRSRRRSMDK